jgi:hypothetical protein
MIRTTEQFSLEEPSIESQILDYGGYHRGHNDFTSIRLTNLTNLVDSILLANENGTAFRVRGNGHSMNGSALPRSGEILFESKGCNHYHFSDEGYVTVGAGSAIWDVNEMLTEFGFELLVINDGGQAAATVGGYLNAGGFGAGSAVHGGFWESVAAVVLVTGGGQLLEITPEDELFPWLFGSMGQLGVIFEVKLRIQTKVGGTLQYPKDVSGNVQKSLAIEWPSILWYTFFVPVDVEHQALQDISEIATRHQSLWRERPPYRYDVAFYNFNPPLIFNRQESFVAIGIWGTKPSKLGFDFNKVMQLECDLQKLVSQRPLYYRYIQTELMFENFDLSMHFGTEVYRQFVELKKKLDPKNLLVQGLLPSY